MPSAEDAIAVPAQLAGVGQVTQLVAVLRGADYRPFQLCYSEYTSALVFCWVKMRTIVC